MKTRQTTIYLLMQAVLCLGLLSSASASTIFWGSQQNLDVMVDSAGVSLDSSYQFELGYFDVTGGWAPTSQNMSEWETRWIVFDKASNGDGWTPATREINASADHTSSSGSTSLDAAPTSVFTQGAGAYLWVYNTKSFLVGSEWALLCDSDKGANVYAGAWEFPDPDLPSSDSFDWQTRDLDTAIFGGVNNTQGAGIYSVNPGIFTIQTHVVPEPGSALLLLMSGLLFKRRRRVFSLPVDS
jgi:MprA protease rhombosortase-interaction domain-containing protein